MKFLKYFSYTLFFLLLLLFLVFGIEYKAGYYGSNGDDCVVPTGQKEVYVHWLLPLNNTLSNFCDGSMTPSYYKSEEMCSCTE